MGPFDALLGLNQTWGDELWEASPALYFLSKSAEIDLHFGLSRILEPSSRSDGSLFKFLDFCANNHRSIAWKSGALGTDLIFKQKQSLETHRVTINAIMGRRDKYFAHLDKAYFFEPRKIFEDYPLDGKAALRLANCVVEIVSVHQNGLTGGIVTGNLYGFLNAAMHQTADLLIAAHRRRLREIGS